MSVFWWRSFCESICDTHRIYDSPRKLCPVLMGAIEGAAERYEEQVYITERTCMKHGDSVCRFEVRFSAPSSEPTQTPEQQERHRVQQQFAQFIFTLLPDSGGITLAELQTLLTLRGVSKELTRPACLLEALRHLHHAGLVATTANRSGDDFTQRRYWHARTSD